MPERVRGGSAPPTSTWQSHLLRDSLESSLNVGDPQRLAAQRDEYMIVEGRIGTSLLQIALEPSTRCVVQRDQPALLELGLADQ